MESGSSGNREESKVASGDDAAMISPAGPDQAAATAPAVADAGEESAASPPAPAAASPKPYYECVFCKRGFTTAQALGGHMNIHRRDRAKPTRDSLAGGGGMTTVSRNVECYNKYRHLVTSYPAPAPATAMGVGSSSSSFGLYYPGTGMAAAAVDTEVCASPSSSVSPRELSLFGAATARDHDLHLGLACHGDSGDGSSSCVPEAGSSEQRAAEPERELDLELRLGRRPRH